MLVPAPVRLLGEQLEVVARHHAHGLAQIGQQARRARRLVDGAVELAVGPDNVVGHVDGAGQQPELVQLVRRDARRRQLRRFTGQRRQDGEVVHRVLGV